MYARRFGVWLVMAASAGACDRCSWRLEYVEADDTTASGSSYAETDGTTLASTGDMSGEGAGSGSSSGDMASSEWTMDTSSGGAGTSGMGETGADDIAAPQPFCGDGTVDPSGECDDGDDVDMDA